MLGRTMHDFAFDAIHDEIVVTNPFAQAILTFRGGARGEEAPKRIIQGPHTRIVSERGMDKVGIDPVNNEIYVATSLNEILVFPREANGDVAPIRILGGSDTKVSGRPAIRIQCLTPNSADVSHHPFQAEIDELVACVREKRDTSIDVFDAQKTMEVCIAADRSAEQGGKPVALPLIAGVR